MKFILLSADGDTSAYLVPDEVADNLRDYCINFCDKWLLQSPHAKKYRINGGVCYTEVDFIDYLNNWIFPDRPCKFIENIGFLNSKKDIPQKYKNCKIFNF